MPGMRRQKYIVKSPYQRNFPVQYFMPEKPEHFVGQFLFLQSVMMVKPRLSRPAEINGGGHVPVAPFHDFHHLFPVVNFFKLHIFHRSSCDNHTVKFLILYLVKYYIKFVQMACRSILRLMAAHHHKSHVNLKRSIGEGTQKLQLCLFFQRHQIQNQDLNWADILMDCPVLIHNKYIFSL